MSKPIVISVVLTLVLTFSSFAYTYTCQEGHFQIDVPEGWIVSTDEKGLILSDDPSESSCSMYISRSRIDAAWWPNNDPSLKSLLENERQKRPWLKSHVLNEAEVYDMGIDEGVIFSGFEQKHHHWIFRAELFKKPWVYWFSVDLSSKAKGTDLENTMVKILNSFRALD